MRIGIAKPDFGIQGGFERYLARLAGELEHRGHQVGWCLVPTGFDPGRPLGVGLRPDVAGRLFEISRYCHLVREFRQLDLRMFDAVLSTQPPSYAARGAAQVSIFFHHLRIYYDLSDLYVEAGYADPDLHAHAQAIVRRTDELLFADVGVFLAGSANVEQRLRRFCPRPLPIAPLRAAGLLAVAAGSRRRAGALCVSRHEFPKRTELFVAAMKRLPGLRGTVIGGGGRLGWVRALDAHLSEPGVELDAVDERALWMSPADILRPWRRPASTNLHFLQGVSDELLRAAFAGAACVVAPAYDEDYGLTALEAMASGTPVVTCTDGGGLAELVEDGVTGLVVEPSGAAIAAAVQRLVEDPDLAREMGERGREVASRYTVQREVEAVLEAVERARS